MTTIEMIMCSLGFDLDYIRKDLPTVMDVGDNDIREIGLYLSIHQALSRPRKISPRSNQLRSIHYHRLLLMPIRM